MHLTRLRLSGFKSFVDPTEFRIEPGVTGVVGPNGCGKSNLLEALRWVMGANSAKAMRAGGMDEVIFAGASNRPSRNHAEVRHEAGGYVLYDRGSSNGRRAHRLNGLWRCDDVSYVSAWGSARPCRPAPSSAARWRGGTRCAAIRWARFAI